MPDDARPEDPAILHFDPDRSAIIEPSMWHPALEGMPTNGVMTWMADAFAAFLDRYEHEEIYRFPIESSVLSVYRVETDGGPIAAALAQVGAPISAILLETMISLGATCIVSIGSSGGLVPELPPGTVVIPTSAIRDEGVSHHYAEASIEARPDPRRQQALLEAMVTAGEIPTTEGIVWTTDAFYRETSGKVERRRSDGAIAVDMEVSALATVAAFRGIEYGAAVYMADTLHSDQWDPSELVERNTAYRLRILDAAAVAASA